MYDISIRKGCGSSTNQIKWSFSLSLWWKKVSKSKLAVLEEVQLQSIIREWDREV